MPRKICVVTGTRAEFGQLRWLMTEVRDDPALSLQTAVTGMHLSPRFGNTYQEIEAEGFTIDAKVAMDLSDDCPSGVARAMGQGVIGFSEAFDSLRPDIVVLLGDRLEALAAAETALVQRIPVAHLHGGEVTEGAIDDSMRHAITKLSSLHFVATEDFRRRVLQLGETPGRVFTVGGLGVDALARLEMLDREALEESLDFQLDGRVFLVTYHPETATDSDPAKDFAALLAALEAFEDARVVFTRPNSDAGNSVIRDLMDQWVEKHRDRARAFESLGQLRYPSLLRLADLVLGNSSSAVIEAPALKTATVNIGQRQTGRPRADSVLDCPAETDAITEAIATALGAEFQARTAAAVSPYGEPGAAERIKDVLKAVPLEGLLVKRFHDWEPAV